MNRTINKTFYIKVLVVYTLLLILLFKTDTKWNTNFIKQDVFNKKTQQQFFKSCIKVFDWAKMKKIILTYTLYELITSY